MTTQSEKELEDKLVAQLVTLGYEKATIQTESELIANLKRQLEAHNGIAPMSDAEWAQVLNTLQKGSIFEKAQTLRRRIDYAKDDGTTGYLLLLDMENWCQNKFQVARQITMQGKYENRYDVTILINGFPLVQIELKRRGLELKEAFEQTNRYERHSYAFGSGLFQYIQLFVISNGVNTKYYANNKITARSFKQTFYWTDESNRQIRNLQQFGFTFLDPCHISKMITRYVVLNETHSVLMVLRPYQYYATEAIIKHVEETEKNGYIWHTTGSGKTLTSFKTSQILSGMPDVCKVVFVVDRKDLDYQTSREFNSFSKGSVDATGNTKKLVEQFGDDTKLIVTTIQKLDIAIRKERYKPIMEPLRDKKLVFIFDECHRSHFGDTHKRIEAYFPKSQLFGFTGTPIFAKNAVTVDGGKMTTQDLFGTCLHKYVIVDAIRDENVLKFSIDYISTFKRKDDIVDIEVEAIDTPEVMEAPERIAKVVDYAINYHGQKTRNREFTAMFCVSNIPTLIQYYEEFKRRKLAGDHDLKIATIFSYQANETDQEAKGFAYDDDETPDDTGGITYAHSREKLDEYIADYNRMFGTNFSTDSLAFDGYYKDISKKVRNKHVDILLVVNMFLTGFDSPSLNTLYVDKNLKYHGLIQAFSRTNRILNEQKSQGNIVCFRNLKSATDEAIELFSNKDASSEIITPPYEQFVADFNKAVIELFQIAPTVASVDKLLTEEDELAFVKAFRELIRLKNKLSYFSDFDFDDLAMDEQTFDDFKSKYLDLYDKVRSDNEVEKTSILGDINFELELIHRDEINVAYILRLLSRMAGETPEEQEKTRKAIDDIISGNIQLRSKKELIDRFINENLALMTDEDNVEDQFIAFWNREQLAALSKLSEEENMDLAKLQSIVGDILFTEKKPLRADIMQALNSQPALKERTTLFERITRKISNYIETFIEGM
jgi:type I restriction enzyme R subunit